ncbi:hypothetical protein [Pseudomonas sp.]|uniref:hypothetical protein n=1 Tax=Pseudomonas sp. TaxID=306 RepID=UPI00262E3A01|nr:hypothetical protein [Pseudomonas sp.]
MTDYNYHLHQLPNFLISEVNAAAGPLHGLPLDQIIARYRSATDHLITVKRAKYQAVHSVQLTKVQMDEMTALLSTPGFDLSRAPHFQFMLAQIGYESIRFLSNFNNYLISAQAQFHEAARQFTLRQAEEAARQLAQRHAEEAARQLAQRHAEEAARLLSQAQAEEAARQLAQHQAEEAARELARRQAEEAARQLAQLQAEAAGREVIRLQMAEVARLAAERQADLAHLLLLRPDVEEAAVQQIVERTKEEAFKEAERIEAASNVKDAAGNPVKLIPEAMVLAEVDKLALKLESDVRVALAEFSQATGPDMGIPEIDAFNAMLYAFKQSGIEVQVAY